ncbi:MAG TPA: PLP-dependent aminotransferase family protein [Candidatus Limnocylindrales bacterium]|nr:PLP-dependent aminotransferase family protein [Candidatus Limnocylindrales bacterium]
MDDHGPVPGTDDAAPDPRAVGGAPADPSLVQFSAAAGVIDLAWGHPGSDLLPVDGLRAAADRALGRYGPDALNYGAPAGPGPLLEWLAGHVAAIDGRAPAESELLVTGGASQGLDLVATVLAEPGDVWLVPDPTYHLAVGIIRDHPVEVVAIETDDAGPRPEAIAGTLARLRREGRRARFMYLVPTFGNPTGITVPLERRRAILELAAEAGLLVVEDDVYRELGFGVPAPPSLWALAPAGTVIRLGSFSKTLAPGLRLGWLSADAPTVDRLADGGLLASGGGVNHYVALVVAEHTRSGAYVAGVERLRSALAARRDALVESLREHLPEATFAVPEGGYFVWLRLPGGLDARALAPAAARHAVAYLPGSVFAVDGGGDPATIRLAFSCYPPADLAEGARRLGAAVAEAR